MVRKPSNLLVLMVLCGLGQAGISVADGSRFIGHLPQGTVELVGITNYPPTNKSQWWQPDGSVASIGPFRPLASSHWRVPPNQKKLAFLVRFENLPAAASSNPIGGINSSTTPEWGPYTIGTRSWLSGSGPKWNVSRDPIPGSHMWEAMGSSGQ